MSANRRLGGNSPYFWAFLPPLLLLLAFWGYLQATQRSGTILAQIESAQYQSLSSTKSERWNSAMSPMTQPWGRSSLDAGRQAIVIHQSFQQPYRQTLSKISAWESWNLQQLISTSGLKSIAKDIETSPTPSRTAPSFNVVWAGE